jgi:hypothetical protein
VLDIIGWEQIPPFMPRRAAYYYSGVPTIDTIYFRVRGRKRISVVSQVTIGQNCTISAYRVGANGVLRLVDSAAATTSPVEFVTTYNEAVAGASGHGYSIFDYVVVTKNGGSWIALDVQAWDD